jgi:hypothetical protein
MKKNIYKVCLSICFLFFGIEFAKCQDIIGTYDHQMPGTAHAIRLSIKKDSSYFLFNGAGDVVGEGVWQRKKNTLSFFDSMKKGFDITVEEVVDSSVNNIEFSTVLYSDGSSHDGAVVVFDDNASTKFVIGTEKSRLFPGQASSFRIEVCDRFYSKNYIIRSRFSNLFRITINKKYYLCDYSIFDLNKVLIKNSDTIQLCDTKDPKLKIRCITLSRTKQ